MNFLDYLISKKIDATAFAAAEPDLYHNWQKEFDQMHPNSFTVQKLNLINPIRRKYTLASPPPAHPTPELPKETPQSPAATAPKVARPMMRPKPKIN